MAASTDAAKDAAIARPVPVSAVSVRSYEERLKEAPGTDWKDTEGRARRAAILIEWLATDRNAAMRFLAKNRFEDLWLPGLAKAIGSSATASELLLIANNAKNADEAISQIGQWASPAVVNELAGSMASVNPEAAASTAGAVSALLAHLNLDRALAFARSQPTDEMRASAMGGVLDELRSGPNGDAAVRTLYASLPPSIQSADPVLFNYGNAIWGSDPVGALQALEGISSAQMRTTALLVLARETASSSPETAIAAVYASGLTAQGVYNHVSPILQSWSAVDPQAAANFLSTTQIIPSADIPKYAPVVAPPGGGKG